MCIVSICNLEPLIKLENVGDLLSEYRDLAGEEETREKKFGLLGGEKNEDN